jgi:hypothetical protein
MRNILLESMIFLPHMQRLPLVPISVPGTSGGPPLATHSAHADPAIDDCGDARWPSQLQWRYPPSEAGVRECAQPGTIVKQGESPRQETTTNRGHTA